MARAKANTTMRIYRIMKPFLRLFMKLKFNLEADVPDEVKKLKPPYIVLANHQGFWDAVSVGANIPSPVSFVATDAIFRTRFHSMIFHIMGVIPKTKALTDMDTLKNIFRVRDVGGVIGIFPETRRTWDGTTLPLLFSVSKLVKVIKIPIVTAVIKGGYFSHPRWGANLQKGKIRVEYKLLFNKDESKAHSAEEIHSSLITALDHDEFAWQETAQIRYKGKNPAESLELVLFICPSCGRHGVMSSKGKIFRCDSCGYEVEYTPEREFISHGKKLIFKNIRDWSRWQRETFTSFLGSISDDDTEIAADHDLEFHTGFKNNATRHFAFGSLRLTRKALTITDEKGAVLKVFPVDQLAGIEAQNKERMEFYYDKTLYNVRSRKRGISVNKWLWAFEYLLSE